MPEDGKMWNKETKELKGNAVLKDRCKATELEMTYEPDQDPEGTPKWCEKYSKPGDLDEEVHFEEDDSDDAAFQETSECVVIVEEPSGTLTGGSRPKAAVAAKGKKSGKYRPLTQKELEDFQAKEAALREEIQVAEIQSWAKPVACKHQTADRKWKDNQAKKGKQAWEGEKEEQAWEEEKEEQA